MTPETFISKYAFWAVLNGAIQNVPPSIALSQAALESGWGKYVIENNLFGIKADPSWSGPVAYYGTTEEIGGQTISQTSGFRAYRSPLESFRDHSFFLKENSRYRFLFDQVPFLDYQAWAHGLKAAGYATNSTYASKLINIIEDHQLDQLDRYSVALKYTVFISVAVLVAWAAYKYGPRLINQIS